MESEQQNINIFEHRARANIENFKKAYANQNIETWLNKIRDDFSEMSGQKEFWRGVSWICEQLEFTFGTMILGRDMDKLPPELQKQFTDSNIEDRINQGLIHLQGCLCAASERYLKEEPGENND